MKINKGKLFLRILITLLIISVMTYFYEIGLGNIYIAHERGLSDIDNIFIVLSVISLIILWVKSK